MFTDGVTEARNAADDEYGIERLKRVASRRHAVGTHLLDGCLEDMCIFRGETKRTDDVALLSVLRRA
jgi:serine phosphatase RsbU (regulator of sigma subunit)